MSLAAACWWTLARTILLCLIAWPIMGVLERWLRGLAESKRPLAFMLLLIPFLFPELLVGYTYRGLVLATPQRAEWLCAGLLLVRIVPVGVVTLLVSPWSLIGATAIHSRWILVKNNPGSLPQWWQLVACYWQGPIRRAIPALVLMSLVAFQEFELAALLQTASWTDWFITAQRFGLSHTELIQRGIWPLIMQLPLLVAAVMWLASSRAPRSEQVEIPPIGVSGAGRVMVWIYLSLALVIGFLIPVGMMGVNLPDGLKVLIRQPAQWTGLGKEILAASAVSLCAGLTTWFSIDTISFLKPINRAWKYACRLLLVPGLFGSLLLSLASVALFQQSWLRPLYDTPIPWVLTLIVWLLPRAILLRLWLAAMTPSEAVHLAELLETQESSEGSETKSSERNRSSSRNSSNQISPSMLLFRLRDQPRYLAMGLLCYWAYLDLSTAYLLAPSGMVSGLVRLYNFMHFGRSAALSAESLLFFGTPLVATFVAIQILRLFRRS